MNDGVEMLSVRGKTLMSKNGVVILARVVWSAIGTLGLILLTASSFFASNWANSIDRRLSNIERWQEKTFNDIADLKAEAKSRP